MKKSEVEVGATYMAIVSGCPGRVQIVAANPCGGWTAISLRSGRGITIRSARRLRPLPMPRAMLRDLILRSRLTAQRIVWDLTPLVMAGDMLRRGAIVESLRPRTGRAS